MIKSKLLKKISIFATTFFLSISSIACSFPKNAWQNEVTPTEQAPFADQPSFAKEDLESFNQFTLEILKDELSGSLLNVHYYVKDTKKLGIPKPDYALGDYEFDTLGDTSEITKYLNQLKSFNYGDLSKEQQIIYDMLKYNLELQLEYCDLYLYGTELTPYTGINVVLPTLLTNYNFYSKEDVDDYIAILNDTPRYFKQVIQFENLRSKNGLFMSDDVAGAVVKQCEDFIDSNKNDNTFLISTFNTRIDDLQGLSQAEKDSYKSANKKAVLETFVPSYKILIDGVESLKGTSKYSTGLSATADGKKYYEYLIKSDFGWSKSIDDLDAFLDQYITSSVLYLQGSIDANLENRLIDFKFTQTDPKASLEDLREKLKKDFPDAPNVDYTIKSIDKSLEKNSNPAMYLLPQIDNYTENIILINELDCTPDSLYPILAHEGYPGHLYQSTYFASKNPNPIRRLLAPNAYMEGWATYVELYSYTLDDKANDDNAYAFMANNQRLLLAIYAKMDIGVNYYGWSKDFLDSYLRDWGISGSFNLDEIYRYLISEPASYPRYAVGGFAFEEWKTTAKAGLGSKFDTKKFHQFLLDLGPAQFDIVDKELAKWIQAQK